MMKRKVKFAAILYGYFYKTAVAGLALILSLSLSGCFLFPKEEEVLAPPLKEPPKIVYNHTELKKVTIENKKRAVGYFISIEQSDLSFKHRGGRLKKIYVAAGAKVKKGDLLAELDTDNLENQVKQQEIILKKSQLAYEQIKTSGRKDIDMQEIQLESLKKQYGKMISIPDAYSIEQIENLKQQIKENEILYKSAKFSYETNLKTSYSDVELNKLQLDNLRQELSNSKLVSPMDGTVDYVADCKQGENIDAYRNIIRIADSRKLQVQYSEDQSSGSELSGSIASVFEIGQKVALSARNVDFSGEVVMTPSTAPDNADEKTQRAVRIKIDKVPEGVKIGDSVEIVVTLGKKDKVIAIPKNHVHKLLGRTFVHIFENGLRKEKDVELGIENQTEVEVVKGLDEGDKLIRE
ncbi:MAG: biotin/lipoyl-binding protein [Clostridia bacterium]|nr:biotin/lipoyl-binding protein [Clostridia bacterium]